MVRKKAYECLKEILLNQGFSNLTLKGLPNSMNSKDKALVTQIVYGTLQNYDFLTYQWSDKVKKKVKKNVEILINMSVYQLLFLDRIPDYAVVSEAQQLVNEGQRSFVQAILFSCIKQGRKEIEETDPIKALSIRSSIPVWILGLFKSHYGLEETIKIVDGFMSVEHDLVARINPLKADLNKMRNDSLITFLDDWAVTSKENLLESDYFKNGEIVIQDWSSQQVAYFVDPQPNETILDACSAPGTKTGMMAAMMNNQGKIIASDLHNSRLELVKKGASKLGVSIIETVQMDASKAHEKFESEYFDRILLDVPCSGLGVLKGKPELRWRILPEDLDSLVKLQAEILESCVGLLKSGGVLVYSTCTLNKKENNRQVEAFLARHPEMMLDKEMTCFPYIKHQDGFYMARMLKR